MKLYLAAGQYVGTQADAKKLDKTYSEEIVPVDKEGLIAYLNELVSSVKRPLEIVEPKPTTKPVAEAKPFSGSLTDVEEFIQNADHVQLGRVTENAILRMRELMDGAAGATSIELDAEACMAHNAIMDDITWKEPGEDPLFS